MTLLTHLYDTPWVIAEPALRQLIDVATRASSDPTLAASLRAERDARPAAVASQRGRPLDGTTTTTVDNGVAIIPIIGPIVRYGSMFADVSGLSSVATIAADLAAAAAAPSVTAIMLRVDSPGGEVTGIAALAAQIAATRAVKPIWAYVEQAASAGYWLASAADRVVVDTTAIVGSVGVVLALRDPAGLPASAKTIEIVSSNAPHKRPDVLTEGGRAQYQALVDATETVFIDAVAAQRGVSADTVRADFGRGGVLVGDAAVAAGMADARDSFEATLAHLRATRIVPAPSGRVLLGGHMSDPLLTQLISTPVPDPAALAAALAAQSEIAALRTQMAAMQHAAAQTAGATFAASLVASAQALPAERDAIAALHIAASTEAPSLLPLVIAAYTSRPAHTLATEQVAVTPSAATAATATPDAARKAALLALTPLGRATHQKESK